METDFTIALDLEGTLIVSAGSMIPRPGLYEFLENCRSLGRVVVYSVVEGWEFKKIAESLIDKGIAPAWFASIEHYHCDNNGVKDLDLISGTDADHAVLIDDNNKFVAPGQMSRWIQIMYVWSNDPEEQEFERVLRKIKGFWKETR